MREKGGLYGVICGKKRESSDEHDDGRLTMKPDNEKKEQEGKGFKKDSCAWLAEHEKGNFDIKNYTGDSNLFSLTLDLKMILNPTISCLKATEFKPSVVIVVGCEV